MLEALGVVAMEDTKIQWEGNRPNMMKQGPCQAGYRGTRCVGADRFIFPKKVKTSGHAAAMKTFATDTPRHWALFEDVVTRASCGIHGAL